jgi:hypothetical protein
MHQTSTEHCPTVARLTLTPINPLDHVIAPLIQCIRRKRSNAVLHEEYALYQGLPLMKDLLADQGHPAQSWLQRLDVIG